MADIPIKKEQDIEQGLIIKLEELKYKYRSDIRDRVTLKENFRWKFEELNMVRLSDAEFERLKEQIVTPDVLKNEKRGLIYFPLLYKKLGQVFNYFFWNAV